MLTKDELKSIIIEHLDELIIILNENLLGGNTLGELEPILMRLGKGNVLPYWYPLLKNERKLPNFDGKTVGSILEMLFVAVLERKLTDKLAYPIEPLKINPARGVDIPSLNLGIKSPSTNYCTSEPFFSAYERLYGSENDALILLTDYQEAKKKNRLSIQIIAWRFLRKTELADSKLCKLALAHRDWLLQESEQRVQRLFRFLAYANQSDWRAKQLLQIVTFLNSPERITSAIQKAVNDFDKTNKQRDKEGLIPIDISEKLEIQKILNVTPMHIGVIDAMDNWVMEVLKDAARAPNENEWIRLRDAPLDGKIGMSFALQWRYNFGQLFKSGESSHD